ncbi:hypothetical protein [Parasphingopyxis sp.]|uniref:hypothetical protein n=1 Tax=Parasphingopyxis sp. TaxID=1920299 RepID=UPI00261956B3|nr:hypothetical protein [Parasphingopyxis sp.]
MYDVYAAAHLAVMAVNAVCVGIFFVVLLKASYFDDRPGWRWAFLVACIVAASGLLADIVNWQYYAREVHWESLIRYAGNMGINFCAIGLHWQLWRSSLVKGSMLDREGRR